eukprot:5794867-Amphidinium_carterae.1
MNAVEAVVPAPDEGVELDAAVGLALHMVVSAINHDCAPNCALQTGFSWPELRGWAVVQTLRSVSDGEELTIAYVPEVPERRELLHEQWCFRCECDLCVPNK